jgi:hypothetical protein
MKTKALIIIAAVAVLTASCGRISRQVKGILTYPTTPEEVAEMAELYNSDAALVVTKADTQYVLYRDRDHDGCYAMRYVSKHRCRHDFSARGNKFALGNPEQTMTLNRNGDNALTLSIDSLTIAVNNILATDSALTFRLGFDKADRHAVLYLYGKATKSKDPLAETSIQQMLFLALSLDSLLVETEEQLAEAEMELEEAEQELESIEDNMEYVAQKGAFGENYAVYSQLDSLAAVLGFANKEAKANDDHMIFKAWGGLGGSTNCYERMERMAAVASGKVAYSVHHKPNHRDCTFTASW